MQQDSNNKPDIVFLINNSSGSTRGNNLSKFLESNQGSQTVSILKIDWANIENQIELAKSARLLVLAGGDGTLSSLIPKIKDSDINVSIIALGTGNDLAKSLSRQGEPSLNEVLNHGINAFKNPDRHLDIWQISDNTSQKQLETFINYFSIGFSAVVISKFSKLRNKSKLNSVLLYRLRYILLGIQSLGTTIPTNLNLTGQNINTVTEGKSICLIFSNIYSWMGCSRVQKSDPFDSKLEATYAYSIFSYARMLIARIFPFFTVPHIGSSNYWQIDNLPCPTITNRDGEEFILNTKSVRISHFGKVKIKGVINF